MSNVVVPTFAGCYYSAAAQDVLNADGESAGLRKQSAEVFRYLAEYSDRVVSRDELAENIWHNISVTDDSLNKCVSEIRKAINDDKRIQLKTLPRRGYQLFPDVTLVADSAVAVSSGRSRQQLYILLAVAVAAGLAFLSWPQAEEGRHATEAVAHADDGIPQMAIEDGLTDARLATELRVALGRYRTVKLVDHQFADMLLQLKPGRGQNVAVEVITQPDGEALFAESYGEAELANGKLARRIAASVASPGVGAVDNWLLKSTQLVPVEQLSKAACYAYGYGCSKCSGEEDVITSKAEACLAAILEKDPDDARAWALQATIYAHQYWWASTLPEPARSDPSLRQHLPQQAVDAANRAESLSDGYDTSVYWGMAEAYFASCEADKLQTAVNRGLEINPDDPNLMGAFGNWLSYSGKWEEGAELTLNALEMEPKRYKKWWWMGPAKTAYMRENFDTAYGYFLKAYNERNWVSHLQLAYTLPHLGRLDEAKESAATLQYMYPGFTLEKALETYDLLCFPDSYLENMRIALQQAGLPSRGSSQDLANITLPRANVISVNGITLEYLDVGEGEPIIFVHGAFNDYRSWGHYMVPVSENHRYISYSRRYFGTQEWPDSGATYSVENFAKDLIALIENLEIDGAHLVSWSSGVRTANAVASLRPDLIKSVVHFEPVEGNIFNGMEMPERLKNLEADWNNRWGPVEENISLGYDDLALEYMFEVVFEMEPGSYSSERGPIKELTRQNARTLEATMQNFYNDPIKMDCNYLSRIKVPTLVLYGELTHGYWQAMAERFAECVPDAELAMISGANHYAPVQEIAQISDAVLKFVDAHR